MLSYTLSNKMLGKMRLWSGSMKATYVQKLLHKRLTYLSAKHIRAAPVYLTLSFSTCKFMGAYSKIRGKFKNEEEKRKELQSY